jgi:hypothetical protein
VPTLLVSLALFKPAPVDALLCKDCIPRSSWPLRGGDRRDADAGPPPAP